MNHYMQYPENALGSKPSYNQIFQKENLLTTEPDAGHLIYDQRPK